MKYSCKFDKLIVLFISIALLSCKAYKQDILFQLNDEFSENDLSKPIADAEKNYILQEGDFFEFQVYTNEGERLIDPDFELRKDLGGANNVQRQGGQFQTPYFINQDGQSHLPMIGFVDLVGITTLEAEIKLAELYDEYYSSCYVRLRVSNRRVIVLGANGGQVISLENENMSIAEILALAGGLNFGAKANEVKLIRGDLSNPQVYMIDLTTIEGMRSTILEVQPGDIVYIQPWRRPWLEGLRDVSSIIGLTTGVLTFILFLQNAAG